MEDNKTYTLRKINFIYNLAKSYKDDELLGDVYNKLFPSWIIENISERDAQKAIKFILHNKGNELEEIKVKTAFAPLRYMLLLHRANIDIEQYNNL